MQSALYVSLSAQVALEKRLETIANNMANINTVNPYEAEPFRERLIVAQAVDYGSGEGGVRVAREAHRGTFPTHHLAQRPCAPELCVRRRPMNGAGHRGSQGAQARLIARDRSRAACARPGWRDWRYSASASALM